jgi:hypothetical protein
MSLFQPGIAGWKLVDGVAYPFCILHHPGVCDPQGRKVPYTTVRSAIYRIQKPGEAMVIKNQKDGANYSKRKS